MKKIIFTVSVLLIAFASCKNESATKPVTIEKPLTELEKLEGKLVNAENGEWYVIKDGERWKALSEQATTDYLKSIENGQENVVKNVSLKILDQLPIAGEVLPNAEFKSISEADLLEGKVVSAENGEWFIIKDGQRWIPVSEESTNNYLKSIENGQENVVRNVSLSVLEQFPISGKLLPKVNFQKESKKETAQ